MKIIQDTQIDVFHCQADTNPADYVSKVKPISSYLENPIWEHDLDYISKDDWKIGESIEEIKA